MLRGVLVLWALLLLACGGFGQRKQEAPAQPRGEQVAGLDLWLDFPATFEATSLPVEGRARIAAAWAGKCAGSAFELCVRELPAEEFELEEPQDVYERILRIERRERPNFAFDEQRTLQGRFGFAPLAILARKLLTEEGSTKTLGVQFYLCGVTDKSAYVVEMRIQPMPDAAGLASVNEFFAKGIAWKGKPRDPRWTDEEAFARWQLDAPGMKKLEKDKLLRTQHYVILTNASGGKSFGEKMEECYAAIRAVYAFEESPGERLMPVFLFRNPEEYYEFFKFQFNATLEEARRSKGVASGDFYATWYEAPKDPVHIHEATHQIFGNRLRLRGGGSWFQEGVAEYMSSVPNERNTAARTVKRNRHMPLAKFVEVRSLLFSSEEESKSGEDEASSQYELAAFLIEFLRESKFSRDKFSDWFRAVGAVPRNDVAAIEAATRATLGVDLAGLEAEWIEYAKKR